MNTSSLHTLVNFRASKPLLESFDRVCLLSGKTRTQVFSEMMRQRVLHVGSKLPEKLETQRSIDERLKIAVEGRSSVPPADTPRTWSVGTGGRVKPFSSFDQVGS
ncbi:hypothetical protein [Sphingomonas sp. BK481]|uniref:hypothetical protein n=1 Tax=Sphingomonas sp. BK481 TaxID=2586981 RepID=UPI00160A8F07|nr:hypothetical protein [Sphingomonas sp. BK481]MBB3587774.1 hypothetical protein [Sphingomonas sp. BK481]